MGGEEMTTYYIAIAVSLASLLLIVRSIFSKPRRRLPPGPPGLPVIGHVHLIKPPLHRSLHLLAGKYGPLMHLRLGSTPCVVASSPEIAKEVLKTQDIDFANRPQSTASKHFAYNDSGFAFAPFGSYYRSMRKLTMTELLGARTVDQLRPVRRAELVVLLQNVLAKSRAKEPVDVSWELIKMTYNQVTRMSARTTAADTDEARKLVKQVAEVVGAFNLADFIGILRGFDLQGLDKKMKDVRERFGELMERIIKGKEETRRLRKETGEDDQVKDLLDMVLDKWEEEDDKSETKLTRERIKVFFMDIFAAGSDTSAAAVEWALAELMNKPSVLEKMREEIDRVVGKERLVDEKDVANLPYLQAVVKEALRMHPPDPVTYRECTKDVTVDGYHVAAGTTLIVNLWAVARDPNHWEQPHEFRPERFMDATSKVDVMGQHFHLLPFGSGRRACPGISLALKVVPETLAAMVQCFDWELSGGEASVDMQEGVGLVIPRAKPLMCVPVARLDPFPELH